MKTKAAICYAAGKPLEVVTVDLAGPKAGEVLVEIKASGVCHTDEFTRSGADPEGLFPVIFGHEGAGIVVEVGAGVSSLRKGDHVIPLYTPELWQARPGPEGQRRHPAREEPFLPRRPEDSPLHGLLDLFQFHGPARDCG